MKYITRVNDEEFIIEIDRDDEITVNGEVLAIDFSRPGDGGMLSLLIENRSVAAMVEDRGEMWEVLIHGELYEVKVQDERAHRLALARGGGAADSGKAKVESPMPGVILDVLVSEGDVVAKGDKLVILESMKMENELLASRDGLVLRVSAKSGDNVEKGQLLVLLGEAE